MSGLRFLIARVLPLLWLSYCPFGNLGLRNFTSHTLQPLGQMSFQWVTSLTLGGDMVVSMHLIHQFSSWFLAI